MRAPDYLPISMLNQLAYCERRFWLMFVHREMVVNAPVLQGLQQHQLVHSAGSQRDGRITIHRRVYLWSDELRVSGFADLIEERGERLVPVEYKRGRMGRWLNDQLQLCAQAMCLEEMLGVNVPCGALYYGQTRHRLDVTFDHALREETEKAAARARELIQTGVTPKADYTKKCKSCSLQVHCIPKLPQKQSVKTYLARMVEEP